LLRPAGLPSAALSEPAGFVCKFGRWSSRNCTDGPPRRAAASQAGLPRTPPAHV